MSLKTHGAVSAGELEAIIARTALKYDLLPYTSNPFPQSQPACLAGLARFFGLEAVQLAEARVLELGCAAGGNIIPHAVRYPGARFVGVDLSRTQVAAGRARISRLGLSNIEILCQSFTELSSSEGSFDYIICHGVYSWVPRPVQDAILRICQERLSPHGLAMISYNVLPGWRQLQALRDAFLLHVPDQTDSRARVAEARAFLAFLKDATPDRGAYKQLLATWSDRLQTLPEDYIAHEFLEEINEPCTVRDFVAAADAHGLAYIGDTDLASMVLDNLPAGTADQIRRYGQNQFLATEQYLDILNGRTFRQSVLVSRERGGAIQRNVAPAMVDPLHVLGGRGLVTSRNGAGGTIQDPAGRSLMTTSPEVMSALQAFAAAFPATTTVDGLLAATGAGAEARPAIQEAVFKMTLCGLATLYGDPVLAAATLPEKPIAIQLARGDAAAGALATTNLRHEHVTFDSLGQLLLPLMDGTRDASALTASVLAAVRLGRLTFSRDGDPVTARDDLQAVAEAQVQALLTRLVDVALIEPVG